MRGRLLLVLGATLAIGSCAGNRRPTVPRPEPTHLYLVPLSVRSGDQICVELPKTVVPPCVTVGELRLQLLSVRATP